MSLTTIITVNHANYRKPNEVYDLKAKQNINRNGGRCAKQHREKL
jgi:hypothetical protein